MKITVYKLPSDERVDWSKKDEWELLEVKRPDMPKKYIEREKVRKQLTGYSRKVQDFILRNKGL